MPEFLLWIPSLSVFAAFHFGSKTARREAPNLKSMLENKQAATLKCTLIVTKKYKWHGPVITVCSTPLSSYPSTEDVILQVTTFANPKESEVEKVDSSTTNEERPR